MVPIAVRCRTQGGIFTTPGEAYTTPIEMWIKGLGEFSLPTLGRNQIFLAVPRCHHANRLTDLSILPLHVLDRDRLFPSRDQTRSWRNSTEIMT